MSTLHRSLALLQQRLGGVNSRRPGADDGDTEVGRRALTSRDATEHARWCSRGLLLVVCVGLRRRRSRRRAFRVYHLGDRDRAGRAASGELALRAAACGVPRRRWSSRRRASTATTCGGPSRSPATTSTEPASGARLTPAPASPNRGRRPSPAAGSRAFARVTKEAAPDRRTGPGLGSRGVVVGDEIVAFPETTTTTIPTGSRTRRLSRSSRRATQTRAICSSGCAAELVRAAGAAATGACAAGAVSRLPQR